MKILDEGGCTMSFAEQLKVVRQNRLGDYALEFAEYIKPKLVEEASKGCTSLTIELEGLEKKNIMVDSEFHSNLEILLEGCKVCAETKEFTNPFFKNKYKKRFLVITWE